MNNLKQMVIDIDKHGNVESIVVHHRDEMRPLIYDYKKSELSAEMLFGNSKLPMPSSIHREGPIAASTDAYEDSERY